MGAVNVKIPLWSERERPAVQWLRVQISQVALFVRREGTVVAGSLSHRAIFITQLFTSQLFLNVSET